MRPQANLDVKYELGSFVPEGWHFATVRFYHPDDVENNRSEKEELEWPLRMPTAGMLQALNPIYSQVHFLSPDPYYNNWLFCSSDVYQWDWNGLLTTQEYLDYVERTPNLLQLQWRASQYADPITRELLTRKETLNPDRVLRESVEKRAELRAKRESASMSPTKK